DGAAVRGARVGRGLPGGVVVGEPPGRGGADRIVCAHRGVDRLPKRLGLPWREKKVEVERGVELVVPDVLREALGVVHPGFRDEYARFLVAVSERTPAAVDLVNLVAVPMRMVDRIRAHRWPDKRA